VGARNSIKRVYIKLRPFNQDMCSDQIDWVTNCFEWHFRSYGKLESVTTDNEDVWFWEATNCPQQKLEWRDCAHKLTSTLEAQDNPTQAGESAQEDNATQEGNAMQVDESAQEDTPTQVEEPAQKDTPTQEDNARQGDYWVEEETREIQDGFLKIGLHLWSNINRWLKIYVKEEESKCFQIQAILISLLLYGVRVSSNRRERSQLA